MAKMHIAIIGGGVAGLATAAALGAAGSSVTLIEREPYLFGKSSGQNAGIFRSLEEDGVLVELARESRRVLESWKLADDKPWLDQAGLVLAASAERQLEKLCAIASSLELEHELYDRRSLQRRFPLLDQGETEAALWVPDAGVLDIQHMCTLLRRKAQAHGVRFLLGTSACRIEQSSESVQGVWLERAGGEGSEQLRADAVVLAAGAHNRRLARDSGADVPLSILRRHLVQLKANWRSARDEPVVWSVSDPAYFRPESGGYLCSPCDETPQADEVIVTDPSELERLYAKLAKLAPRLSSAKVQRVWACVRTFAPDRRPVVGPDTKLAKLYWVAGLGGSGMASGVALGKLAAELILQRDAAAAFPFYEMLLPARFGARRERQCTGG